MSLLEKLNALKTTPTPSQTIQKSTFIDKVSALSVDKTAPQKTFSEKLSSIKAPTVVKKVNTPIYRPDLMSVMPEPKKPSLLKSFQNRLDTKYQQDQAKVNAGKPKATAEELKPKINAPKVIRDIVNIPVKAVTSIGIQLPAEILSLVKRKRVEAKFTPKTTFEKMIFGEEPIRGIFEETKDAEKTSFNTLKKLGIGDNEARGMSLALAPFFVGSMKGLDLTPIGGAEKKVTELIAKSSNLDEIFKLAKPLLKGKTDEEIMSVAKDLVKVTDVKAVESKIQSSLKAVPVVDDPFVTALSKAEAKVEKPITPYVPEKKPGFIASVKQKLFPLTSQSPDVQRVSKEWAAAETSAKEAGNREARVLSHIPEKESAQVLLDYTSGRMTKYSEAISNAFDRARNYARAKGVDVGKIPNYIYQKWTNSAEEVMDAVQRYMKDNGATSTEIADYISGKGYLSDELTRKLKLTPSFNSGRVFPNFETGMKYGLTPKYSHPAQFLAEYRVDTDLAIANRKYLEDLQKIGQVKPLAEAPKGWRPVNIEFSAQPMSAPPKVADMLNGMFAAQDSYGVAAKIMSGVAKTSKLAQEIILSAGAPKTTMNFFVASQVEKEVTRGNGKAIIAALRANSTKQSIEYFAEHSQAIEELASRNIDISSRIGTYKDIYKNVFEKKGIKDKAWSWFGKAFNEKTFQSFMPQMYVQMYEDTKLALQAKGVIGEELITQASDVVKKAFAFSENVGFRGKTTEDTLSAFFFAPKFREMVIGTYMNMAKSISTQAFNPAFSKNRKLVAGMIVSYGLYNIANKKLSGHYMWENTKNNEFNLEIAQGDGSSYYVQWMPSFTSLMKNTFQLGKAIAKGDSKTISQKLGAYLSIPAQDAINILNNQDYFGNPIYEDGSSVKDRSLAIANYLGVKQNHPWVQIVGKYIEGKPPSIPSLIIKALELPAKFETMDQKSQNEYYAANDAKKVESDKKSKAFQPKFDAIMELKNAGKQAEADVLYFQLTPSEKELYKNLKASAKRSATMTSKPKVYKQYMEIRAIRDSGDIATADKMYWALSPEDRKDYQLLKKQFTEE